jgi:hypothetical protein
MSFVTLTAVRDLVNVFEYFNIFDVKRYSYLSLVQDSWS